MARIKFKETVLKQVERYLRDNKNGEFIRTSDKVELRHPNGYGMIDTTKNTNVELVEMTPREFIEKIEKGEWV